MMAYYLEWSTRQCEHLLCMFSAWSPCKIDEIRAGFEDLSYINGPSSDHSPRCTIIRIKINIHHDYIIHDILKREKLRISLSKSESTSVNMLWLNGQLTKPTLQISLRQLCKRPSFVWDFTFINILFARADQSSKMPSNTLKLWSILAFLTVSIDKMG